MGRILENEEERLMRLEHLYSKKLADILNALNIDNVNFIVIGNSLSFGYSMSDSVAPFFDNKNILTANLLIKNINSNNYNFATSTNNSNEKVFDNIYKDRSIEYVKKNASKELNFSKSINSKRDFNIHDVLKYRKEGIIPISSVKEEDYKKYYNINTEDSDVSINSIIESKKDNTKNIIIFNGCTGEIMDSIFRGGNSFQLRSHLKLELINLSKILTELLNKDENIMTVVGSIPEFTIKNIPVLFPVIEIYNKVISNRVKEVPNSYIAQPINIDILHKKNKKIVIDLHGNRLEYIDLTNKFLKTISENIIANDIATSYRRIIKEEVERQYFESSKFNMNIIINLIDKIFKDKSNKCYKYRNELIKGIEDFLFEYFKYYHIYYFPTNKETIENIMHKQKQLLKNG